MENVGNEEALVVSRLVQIKETQNSSKFSVETQKNENELVPVSLVTIKNQKDMSRKRINVTYVTKYYY